MQKKHAPVPLRYRIMIIIIKIIIIIVIITVMSSSKVALIPEIDQLATLLGGLVMVGPENTEQALNVSLIPLACYCYY